MDKKKIFQKQLLQSQITENTTLLVTDQNLYNQLIEKSKTNTLDYNIFGDCKSKINQLLEKKNICEKQTKIKKNKINEVIVQISQLEKDIEINPTIINNKINKEEIIYNDEIDRIKNDTHENSNKNTENITNAYLDKEKLKEEIDIIKNNIELQTKIISNIQIEYHSSRKDILYDLKEHKILKIDLNKNISNLNVINNNYIENISNLLINIENLTEFKKLLVDFDYKNDNDNDNDNDNKDDYNIIKLKEYYTKYNIDNNLSINEKLNLIDGIINNNTNQIILFKRQKLKLDNVNNELISNNVDTYTKKSKNSIITHKNKIKIEKEKIIELESILNTKLNLYVNYQNLIIDIIDNNYQSKIKELEEDIIKANKRLSIVKLRLDLENKNNITLLKTKIDTNKIELKNLHLEIYNNTNEIKKLNDKIEKEKVINNELDILEINIKKYKDNIKQYTSDLLILSE